MSSNKKTQAIENTGFIYLFELLYIYAMLCDKNMYAKIQQKSKERGKSMLQLERQQKILDYLKENRKATTNELSELLGVSTTTIRTDFNQMDKE